MGGIVAIFLIPWLLFFIVVSGIFYNLLSNALKGKKKNRILASLYIIIYSIFILSLFPGVNIGKFIKTLEGDYYRNIKEYDKAFNIYIKYKYYDDVYERIVKNYNEGIKYYFDTGEYRKCINFHDKVSDEFEYDKRRWAAPWKSMSFNYSFESYKHLYQNYIDNGEQEKLFDLKNELKGRYPIDQMKRSGLDLNEDVVIYR